MHRHLLFHRGVMSDVDDLFRRVDSLFGTRGSWPHADARRTLPHVTVDEGEDVTTLSADVPGLSAEGLTVTVEDGTLKLAGHVGTDAEEGWTPVRQERARWDFERTFRLGRQVDADGITAELTDGVLTVRLPKISPSSVTVPVIEA